ncbi:ribbon-helix-helix protein, CopG family [Pseudomonas gingeri]
MPRKDSGRNRGHDELKGHVQHLADARRRTSHWIMREAIAQYVEREEKR